MPSFQHLLILLLLVILSTAFILQDLPLERFERSGHHGSEELFAPERHTRSRDVYRPGGGKFWQRYRMMSG
ncbi:hypothetical protein L5515_013069 [Caenorhabditis briggsae]|uniref:Uncharacterized protein n=1 Tax=Caenorhabditis briggsae TaxID=6238 RepID=A0AAE9J6H0_CAEBR|nr:hypothetical protein L5515_013069 [Caenorhabditis briggsae]